MTGKKKVVIVDDHPLFRQRLAIVDISLKGSSGLELIKSIKPRSIGLPVLVLSMHKRSLYAERAIRAGATGYITKNQPVDEVLLAVRRVFGGELYLSEKMAPGTGTGSGTF